MATSWHHTLVHMLLLLTATTRNMTSQQLCKFEFVQHNKSILAEIYSLMTICRVFNNKLDFMRFVLDKMFINVLFKCDLDQFKKESVIK